MREKTPEKQETQGKTLSETRRKRTGKGKKRSGAQAEEYSEAHLRRADFKKTQD